MHLYAEKSSMPARVRNITRHASVLDPKHHATIRTFKISSCRITVHNHTLTKKTRHFAAPRGLPVKSGSLAYWQHPLRKPKQRRAESKHGDEIEYPVPPCNNVLFRPQPNSGCGEAIGDHASVELMSEKKKTIRVHAACFAAARGLSRKPLVCSNEAGVPSPARLLGFSRRIG